MKADLKQKALGGVAWKFAEKAGMQLAQFVIQIILARILLPEQYGIVGLLTIFIAVSDIFIQYGFTTALIQKKDADDVDFSSVFLLNLAMSVVIYIILFISAPFVSVFYSEPDLTDLMRALSLNVIIGSVCSVHNAVLTKNLDFKKSFVRNFMNVMTQGIVGITAALSGFGAWALVFSKIAGTLVGSVTLCLTVKWNFVWKFSIEKVKKLFSFSSKMLVTNLLDTIFNNIHSLVIGKFFTPAELGFYQRGQQMPQAFMTAIDGSFNEVLYPTLSAVQDDMKKLKSALSRSMKTSLYIVTPALFGIIAAAEPLIKVLLTEKWLPCVPFMQLQCVICLFWPLSARTHSLNAIGRSDITLKLNIIGKVITVIMIAVCIPFGIYAIMLGNILATNIAFWIVSFYVNKHIHYSLKDLFNDVKGTLLVSSIMLAVVYSINFIPMPDIVKLAVQVVTGVGIYVLLSKLFKLDSFEYLLEIAKSFFKRKNNS